jgi:acyl-CoA synthetase (AMP-forming)/AMP-acid ligase II
VGELIVRGANVMRGYFRDPERTAQTLRPGRHLGEVELRSGDLFKADQDGYLYFVARQDDIIKSGGQKVSPREIDAAQLEHPGIAECAVVAVDDAMLGQAPKAFVVARAGQTLDEREIRRHLTRLLEDYMVPKQYVFRDALPKSENGKILKRLLLEEPAGGGS